MANLTWDATRQVMTGVTVIARGYVSDRGQTFHEYVACPKLNSQPTAVELLWDPWQEREVVYRKTTGLKRAITRRCGTCAGHKAEENGWRERARCLGAPNPDLWMSPGGVVSVTGTMICASCPVRDECFEVGRSLAPKQAIVFGGRYRNKSGQWAAARFRGEDRVALEAWIASEGRLPASGNEWRKTDE